MTGKSYSIDMTSVPAPPVSDLWKLDHIGQVVLNLEESARRYIEFCSGSVEFEEQLNDQKVQVKFVRVGGELIELISPLPGNTNLQGFLANRGEGLHHICYRVSSVTSELIRLKKAGIETIDSKPRNGSRGLDVAFLHPKSFNGVLIELCSVPS